MVHSFKHMFIVATDPTLTLKSNAVGSKQKQNQKSKIEEKSDQKDTIKNN